MRCFQHAEAGCRSLILALAVWCGVSGTGLAGDTPSNAARVVFEENDYDTFTVDVRRERLEFLFVDGHGKRLGSLGEVRRFSEAQRRELVFATNGGMFSPRLVPNGLFIDKGLTVYPMDLGDAEGNFYLKPNGVFFLSEKGAGIVPSEAFADVSEYVTYATQSGPMLVHDGRLHDSFVPASESKYIRSGVGIRDGDHVVFAISNAPVNFYDFARLFLVRLGCRNALFLDGGISKMYLPALDRHELDGDFAVVIAVTRPL